MSNKVPVWFKHLIWPTITSFSTYEDKMSHTQKYEEGVLKTSDPIRAAALLSFGIKLIDATPTREGNRLIFCFDDTGDCARLASACFLQDRQVGVRTFTDNLRRCRELIFQFKLSGGDRDSR